MTNTFKTIAAAVLFSSAALGGAFAQSAPVNNGDYYRGVDPQPVINGTTNGGGSVPVIIPGGEGAYYQGVDRMPQVDRMSTGSIDNSNVKTPFGGGDGQYYEGATKPMTE